jgi:ketol-acid reductoisomerase
MLPPNPPEDRVTTLYHDSDADLSVLEGRTLAIVGYGNQGRAQALNLRDSGVSVVIGNIRDAAHEEAEADGFEVRPIAEACAAADAVMLLVPDEVMPQVYAEGVAPALRPGDLISFASGYNLAFGLIEPDPSLDVVLVAPRDRCRRAGDLRRRAWISLLRGSAPRRHRRGTPAHARPLQGDRRDAGRLHRDVHAR